MNEQHQTGTECSFVVLMSLAILQAENFNTTYGACVVFITLEPAFMTQETLIVVHCLATQVSSFQKKDSFVFHTWYVIISLLEYNCTLKHIHSMLYK